MALKWFPYLDFGASACPIRLHDRPGRQHMFLTGPLNYKPSVDMLVVVPQESLSWMLVAYLQYRPEKYVKSRSSGPRFRGYLAMTLGSFGVQVPANPQSFGAKSLRLRLQV